MALVATLFAVVACGSSSTAAPLSQPLPTAEPIKGNPPPEKPPPVEVLAPIEDTSVVFPEDPGGEYALVVTSGLPNGCAEYNGFDVKRNGARLVIAVKNLMPNSTLDTA